jgi:hypothetical protein
LIFGFHLREAGVSTTRRFEEQVQFEGLPCPAGPFELDEKRTVQLGLVLEAGQIRGFLVAWTAMPK